VGHPEASRPARGRPPKNADAPRGRDEVVDAVAAAAIEAFGQRGIARVTVRQVCTVAGVNPGLVHRYIGTKDDLVRLALTRAAEDLSDRLRGGEGPFPSHVAHDPVADYERLLIHLVLEDHDLEAMDLDFPLTRFLVDLVARTSGLDDRDARMRTASVVALDLGWRLFAPLVGTATHLRPEEHDLVSAAVAASRDDLMGQP